MAQDHRLNRRDFLVQGSAVLGGLVLLPELLDACSRGGSSGSSGSGPLSVGNIQDVTGDFNIYGIQQHQATQLALDDINSKGGVLGRQLSLVFYDAQSSLDRYTEFAKTLIQQDKVSVIVAGLTSSSREAIRPIMDQNNELYFYCSLYEGGVCDKNVFITGATASQQIKTMIRYATENWGKTFYTVAPDYNFGTISAQWVRTYASQMGAKVVGEDFLPLTQSNFSTTISKIQAASPAVVVALPVGGNQTAFFPQFAAAGLIEKIKVISTNYGSGNQQLAVSPDAAPHIYAVTNYVPQVDTPANKDFTSKWNARFGSNPPIVSEANDTWNAWHLWAQAVNKAGSLDNDKVIKALEGGLQFDAPEGHVQLDGKTHHLIHEMYIVKGNTQQGFDVVQTFQSVPPDYEQQVCDLIANPTIKKQFTP